MMTGEQAETHWTEAGERDDEEAPRRIQRKRTKGWRKPPGVVNVTGPGKWGNPYRPNEKGVYDLAWCLRAYRKRLLEMVAAGELDLEELRGKDLMCYCKIGAPCHGDILLDEANS